MERLPPHAVCAAGMALHSALAAVIPHLSSFAALVAVVAVQVRWRGRGAAGGSVLSQSGGPACCACAQAIGFGAADVVCNTLIPWAHGPRVDAWMQFYHFSFGLGATVSPAFVAASLGGAGSLAAAYAACAAIGLPPILAVLWLDAPTPEGLAGATGGGLAVVADTPSGAPGEGIGAFVPGSSPADGVASDAAPPPLVPLPRRFVALLSTMLFVYVGIEHGFSGWVSPYASLRGMGTVAEVALFSSAFWGALAAGRGAAVVISALGVSSTTMFTVDVVGCVGAGVVLVSARSAGGLWAGCLLFGLFMSSVFPVVLSVPTVYGARMTARDTSVLIACGDLGFLVVPLAVRAHWAVV